MCMSNMLFIKYNLHWMLLQKTIIFIENAHILNIIEMNNKKFESIDSSNNLNNHESNNTQFNTFKNIKRYCEHWKQYHDSVPLEKTPFFLLPLGNASTRCWKFRLFQTFWTAWFSYIPAWVFQSWLCRFLGVDVRWNTIFFNQVNKSNNTSMFVDGFENEIAAIITQCLLSYFSVENSQINTYHIHQI